MKTYSKYLFQLTSIFVLICGSTKPCIAEPYDEEFIFEKLDQLFAANRDDFKDKELKKIIKEKKVKGMFTPKHFILAKANQIWRITGDTNCIQVNNNGMMVIQKGVVAKYILPVANNQNLAQAKFLKGKEITLDDICYVGPSVAYRTKGGDINHYVPLYSLEQNPNFIPRVVELCTIEIKRRQVNRKEQKEKSNVAALERAKEELTRTFKSNNGARTITGTILSLDNDKISIWLIKKGKIVSGKTSHFSDEDAKWIEEKKAWIKKYGSKLEEDFFKGNEQE